MSDRPTHIGSSEFNYPVLGVGDTFAGRAKRLVELDESFFRDGCQQLGLVREMAVRRCGADAGAPGRLGQTEAFGAFLRHQGQRCLGERAFEIAVVVAAAPRRLVRHVDDINIGGMLTPSTWSSNIVWRDQRWPNRAGSKRCVMPKPGAP